MMARVHPSLQPMCVAVRERAAWMRAAAWAPFLMTRFDSCHVWPWASIHRMAPASLGSRALPAAPRTIGSQGWMRTEGGREALFVVVVGAAGAAGGTAAPAPILSLSAFAACLSSSMRGPSSLACQAIPAGHGRLWVPDVRFPCHHYLPNIPKHTGQASAVWVVWALYEQDCQMRASSGQDATIAVHLHITYLVATFCAVAARYGASHSREGM